MQQCDAKCKSSRLIVRRQCSLVLKMSHFHISQDDMNIWLPAAIMKVFSIVGWLLRS